ncbi:hypothetical protein FBR05_08985, partial [Deltaproteobacteria bacterium PRO3]|nr:hypothetical protein [Deltaproteobacteria bacterium PRO3]
MRVVPAKAVLAEAPVQRGRVTGAEITAYRSRLSEREAVARALEEDILTGRKTIGEFLSWFGLGERPAEPPTTVVL